MRGAWIIKIDDTPVSSTSDIERCIQHSVNSGATKCSLLLAHSAIKDGLVETGIPQINADQLNHRFSFDNIDTMSQEEFDDWFARLPRCMYDVVTEGGVRNMTTVANKLTRRIHLQQEDWDDWKVSEFTQLDQYKV